MSTRYITPSVEAIQEDSEDDSKGGLRGKMNNLFHDGYHRQSRSSNDAVIIPARANMGRERERRRSHRSAGGSRHSKTKGRETEAKRISSSGRETEPKRVGASERMENDRPRIRHRRTLSNRSSSSTSSSDDEEEPSQTHREVLEQARSKLTSPSMISTITSLTASTNRSSGSSGSNSTITQASVSKKSLGKRPEMLESPMSPAVPDAPDVFAYLDNGSTTSLVNEAEEEESQQTQKQEQSDEESEEEQDDQDQETQWPSHEYTTSLPPLLTPDQGSSSSSASSSIHGSDHLSEPILDNDTDRSTSPERSIKDPTSDPEPDHDQDQNHDPSPPTDAASAKIASQIAAAQQRQNLHAHNAPHSFGTPDMARGTAVYPYHNHANAGSNASALSARPSLHLKSKPRSHGETVPETGYELLALRLSHTAHASPSSSSSSSESGENGGEIKIKPMYRKFEALNHRLLLHLQDEIAELEERLRRLDVADTQARMLGVGGEVVPASRRAAQAAGGELQWHKTDVLGRIGFKLAQYNQALAAFHTTQSLSPPSPADISTYRTYLSLEQPIAEVETHFLDPADDLVSVCSSHSPTSPSPPSSRTACAASGDLPSSHTHSLSQFRPQGQVAPQQEHPSLPALALALAIAVLVPILTFAVIPGFVGRLVVVGLVAAGVVGAGMQSGLLDGRAVVGTEGLVCAGVYGGVMVVVAGVVG